MIILNILILFLYLLLYFVSLNYQKEIVSGVNQKEHQLKVLYPMILYSMDKCPIKLTDNHYNNSSKKLEENLKSLYVGQSVQEVKKLYQCRKLAIVLVVLFLANFFSMVSYIKDSDSSLLIDGRSINRPSAEQTSKKVDLDVTIVDDNGAPVLQDDIQIDVDKELYSVDELISLFTKARAYIDETLLNLNSSPDNIVTNLKFITRIPETTITVTWTTGNYDVIDNQGRVHNENLEKEALVWITASIKCQDKIEEYTRYVKVLPKAYTQEEVMKKNLVEAIEQMKDKTKTEDSLTLPDNLEGNKVIWSTKETKTNWVYLILGCIVAVSLYYAMDHDLIKQIDKRNKQMLLDYPEIVNKFTLLVGAGMSVSNAWCKISKDYKEKGTSKRYAYEEMLITYGELMIGISETVAYERFGRRVKLIPYLRFSSLIAQNVKKGSTGLINQLELESIEAFKERKELAKKFGEEAGTKLLLPMMIMLLIVLAIIIVPAFLSFKL